MAHRLVEKHQPFCDCHSVPERTVLLFEKHDFAGRIEARPRAGVLEKHEREQSHDLRFGGENSQQEPTKPYGLLAERDPHGSAVAARRVSFVEYKIDHRRDGSETLAAFNGPRRFEGNIGSGDPRLGARDPLFHCALAHEEGSRNLFDAQSRDDAKRQRDLVCLREIRMTTDKEKPEHVVAVMRLVQPFGHRRLVVVEIGNLLLIGQWLLAPCPPCRVEGHIATNEDKPGRRIARWPILRPRLQSPQARFLEGLLGQIEIPKITEQRRYGPRSGGRQRRVHPGRIGQAAKLPGLNMRSGRISKLPPGFARPSSRAKASVSSSVSKLTT